MLFSSKFTDPPEFYSQTYLWVQGRLDYEDLSSSGLSGESTALGDKRVCSPPLALPLTAGRLAPLVVKAKHRLA